MGITRYHRKFIEVFSKISYPINSLQNKGKRFEWIEKWMEKFNKLKYLLTTSPVLKIVDPFNDFFVCTNAWKEGLGGVLLQENYVVAYETMKLKEHEKNYATHNLELAAIIHALKMWRHFLIGIKCILMADNISLKYLFDQRNLNARNEIKLSFWREYDFEIKHIKGK